MTDAATEPQGQTAPAPDVTGTVAITQPNAEATAPNEASTTPVEEPLEHDFSFIEWLEHFFEPGATSQHFQLIAHKRDDQTVVSVQPSGKAGDLKEFRVDPEDHTVKSVSAPAEEA